MDPEHEERLGLSLTDNPQGDDSDEDNDDNEQHEESHTRMLRVG
jgi:hypothetical protein